MSENPFLWKKRMPKKLTYDYVKNYFKEQGCELLKKKYKNNITKMKYRCSCGNISKICFASFKKGHRCMECGAKKHTFKYIKDYFNRHNCQLLEKEYINNSTKMKYKCSCGNISKICFHNFKQGQKCKKCGTEKSKEKQKHSFKYIQKYFQEKNCILLEKEYKNNSTKMKYKCHCGNISKINFAGFRQGQRCSKCGGNKKHTYQMIKKYFESKDCILLEKEYKNSRTLMNYMCECGNVSKISFNNFKQGRKCMKCSIKKRSGKNHPNYNPNLTDEEREQNRSSPEDKKWVISVYKRDWYTCACCKQRKDNNGKYKKINAHHIKNYRRYKKLRTDLSNGITLCEKCHQKFHGIFGNIDNNKQQLDEFFKSFNCREKAVY